MRFSIITLLVSPPFYPANVLAFPQYASLAGLSTRQLAKTLPILQAREIIPPPGPLKDTSTKRVNNKEHPYIPPGPHDIRGPCPAMNTLANHGYIPRNGIARPSELVTGIQEAFNMGNDLAKIQVYGAHIVSGNLVTDLISIGRKTSRTGTDPPYSFVGGLNDHSQVEGDASVSRADLYFGDNHSFNETVFQQFVHATKKSPHKRFDHHVALDLLYHRFKDSMATNPTFDYSYTRYSAAFNEAILIYTLFVDGRFIKHARRLDLHAARSFFELGKMPHGFHRANKPWSFPEHLQELIKLQSSAHPELRAGKNNGTVNSFTAEPIPQFSDMCAGCHTFINDIAQLYPNATGELRNALRLNLHYYSEGCQSGLPDCPELFPYGEVP